MNCETGESRSIRVLVADDSAFMRTALTRMIESDPSLTVLDTARTSTEAVEKVCALKPDVVTLDIEMPGLDGLEALKRIMRDSPRPVIMISSLTQEGAQTTLDALQYGAFDYLSKQRSYASLDIVNIRADLVAKIHAAAEFGNRMAQKRRTQPQLFTPPRYDATRVPPSVIVIGTSTGGPKALQQILPMLPADLPVPILIVQHMPVGFTEAFARRLNNLSKVTICEAANDLVIEPRSVYIARAGVHMTLLRKTPSKVAIRLCPNPSNALHIPSVDVTMLSVAELFGAQAMGVIMTGMGADGTEGMAAIFRAGGFTLGQDEGSCIVYGMPRACAEAKILRRVVPLDQIPGQILEALTHRPSYKSAVIGR
jgi:two-component system chemotaxis response regulator CheB